MMWIFSERKGKESKVTGMRIGIYAYFGSSVEFSEIEN
jgi:hypothetical protein